MRMRVLPSMCVLEYLLEYLLLGQVKNHEQRADGKCGDNWTTSRSNNVGVVLVKLYMNKSEMASTNVLQTQKTTRITIFVKYMLLQKMRHYANINWSGYYYAD